MFTDVQKAKDFILAFQAGIANTISTLKKEKGEIITAFESLKGENVNSHDRKTHVLVQAANLLKARKKLTDAESALLTRCDALIIKLKYGAKNLPVSNPPLMQALSGASNVLREYSESMSDSEVLTIANNAFDKLYPTLAETQKLEKDINTLIDRIKTSFTPPVSDVSEHAERLRQEYNTNVKSEIAKFTAKLKALQTQKDALAASLTQYSTDKFNAQQQSKLYNDFKKLESEILERKSAFDTKIANIGRGVGAYFYRAGIIHNQLNLSIVRKTSLNGLLVHSSIAPSHAPGGAFKNYYLLGFANPATFFDKLNTIVIDDVHLSIWGDNSKNPGRESGDRDPIHLSVYYYENADDAKTGNLDKRKKVSIYFDSKMNSIATGDAKLDGASDQAKIVAQILAAAKGSAGCKDDLKKIIEIAKYYSGIGLPPSQSFSAFINSKTTSEALARGVKHAVISGRGYSRSGGSRGDTKTIHTAPKTPMRAGPDTHHHGGRGHGRGGRSGRGRGLGARG